MRILVFQHLDVEHPGVFRDFWSEAGHIATAIELDAGERIPAPDGYDLLVAMGGPMDVWEEEAYPWLVAEKAAIRHWVSDLDRPFLGICLGHQLLAAALGGTVGPMRAPEVGLTDVDVTPAGRRDPILAGFDRRIATFQWHGAEVCEPPAGSEILASNAACQTQAIRVGTKAYGFQYHCELTSTTVADWRDIPAYKESLDRALGPERAGRLENEVGLALPRFREDASRLNSNLMHLIDGKSMDRR